MLETFQSAPVAALIFLVTLATSLYGLYQDQNMLNRMMLHPFSLVREKNYYTIISSGLVHANLMHLGFNMFTFYFSAFSLETILGHWQFAVLYLVALIVSDIPTILKQKDNPNYRSLGASGAVSAVIFSYVIFMPTSMVYVFFFPMPMWLFAILYVGYSFYASKKGEDYINHDAHLWGSFSGIILSLALLPFSTPIARLLFQQAWNITF